MEQFPFLEVLILLPLIGALGISFLIPREDAGAVRSATLVITLGTFLVSLPMFWLFDASDSGPAFQFLNQWAWTKTCMLGKNATSNTSGDPLHLLL